ncbi:MAG: ATP-binding protein [Vicinamibacterales bacterium]
MRPRPLPPVPADEAGRVAELKRFEVLDTAADADVDALTRLALDLCQVPIAAVSLVDADRQWYLSRIGLDLSETPREVAFCAHAIGDADVFEVADARRSPDFAGNPLVTGAPGIVFYAGAPLVTPSGHAIGALCVIDHRPRTLSPEQREVLRLLARQVMRRLEQQRSLRALRTLHEERVAHLRELRRTSDTLALSEQRLEMVLDAVEAGYWDWDLASGEVLFSQRFAALFQLSASGPLPVEDVFGAVDDAELEMLHATLGDLFARRIERLWHEFPVRTPDSHPRWIRLRGQVTAWTPSGEPLRALGLAVDITAERQRDHHLRATQKLDAIGALAAGVAHEINTPLQFVSHNLDFLASQCGTLAQRLTAAGCEPGTGVAPDEVRALHDEVAGAIAESIDGIDRVTHIVRALKEFSHHGRGARERVDINQMIENAITLTRHEWKFVAEFERDLAPGLPPVAAAAHECGQVLVNLIVNGAHAVHDAHGSSRKGRLGVRTRFQDGRVEIRLWDTGTGIAADIQDRVFEPFFTTKPVGKGTGQGLATARAVVERHGGTIGFETQPGRGTTFIVRLPAAPGSAIAA